MNMSTVCTSLHRACIIALAAMVAGPTAQAADTTLTLACQGTATVDATPEPISMGIILDLKAGKIDGFGKSLPAE